MFFAILFNFRRIQFIVYWAKNYQLQKVFVKKQSMKKKRCLNINDEPLLYTKTWLFNK